MHELKIRRERLGMTQSDLARRAGLDRLTVVRAERGEPVSARTMLRLAETLTKIETEVGAPFDISVETRRMLEDIERDVMGDE